MKPKPPKNALKFLRWFCREDFLEEIEGDLIELFEQQYEAAPRKAHRRFFWEVLRHFRPDFIKSFQLTNALIHPAMIRHNFIITLRNFSRNRTSFLINLIGLSTGLACVFLIYLWVNDEVNIDKFYKKDTQLFQLMQNFQRNHGIETADYTPAYLAKALKEEMPEVEYATPVNFRYNFFNEEGTISNGNQHIAAKAKLAGKDYFHVFSHPLLQGNKNQVLLDKKAVVLSEELAKRLFKSTENSIGKTLEWEHASFAGSFIVTGIFKAPPANATNQFDLIFNFEQALDPFPESREWYSDAAETYLILKKGTNIEDFNNKITHLLRSKHDTREKCTLIAQQYSTRYLYGPYVDGRQSGGRILYVHLFSIIALFILLIACINFMNLSTARASTRLKEIGVKKATGASRSTLIGQFLTESSTLAVLSAIIAILLITPLLPLFNEITGKELQFHLDSPVLISIAGIVLLTGLLAGSYPAFYLSGFSPVSILKGRYNISLGEKWLRKSLVIFQFALSVVFIGGFLVLNKQITFIQKKQLGYNKDHIINFVSKGKNEAHLETFLSELKNIPGVVNASNIWGGSFIKNTNFGTAPDWEGKESDEEITVPRPHVGYDFIETLGIELKEGRSFSRAYNNEESKIILNEAAVEMIGYEDPIGKILTRGTTDPLRLEIIGVVKNFHNESLHERIKPTFIRFLPNGKDIMVKIKAGEEITTIKKLKKFYEDFHPGQPFEFQFMDDEYQSLYEAESKVAALSSYSAIMAIIISCLGLFGLSMFTAERRKKEIGIRKVLGSSVFGIIRMLSKDFTKTVLIALLIALPISYLIAQNWLTNFAYSIELHWWFFPLLGVGILLIAWTTVGLQTFKAARVNPVECLKEE